MWCIIGRIIFVYNDNNNVSYNSYHLLSTYYVKDSILSMLYVLSFAVQWIFAFNCLSVPTQTHIGPFILNLPRRECMMNTSLNQILPILPCPAQISLLCESYLTFPCHSFSMNSKSLLWGMCAVVLSGYWIPVPSFNSSCRCVIYCKSNCKVFKEPAVVFNYSVFIFLLW